jgi:hypothetical protein
MQTRRRFGILGGGLLVLVGLTMPADVAVAQLMACDQIDGGGAVTLPAGSCIARSLADQVDLGHTDTIIGTPGSGNIQTGSIYLIKHDPARSVRRGRQLFQRKFSLNEGHGPRVNNSSTGDVTQMRALGAGLVDSCAGCHGRPRGSAGHGGVVQTFADSRDSPHLFGLGLGEQLADEMTADLREIRQQAIDDSTGGGGGTVTVLSADFTPGTDGFDYQDDTFNNTNNGAYAFGQHIIQSNGDGIVRVALGNIDNTTRVGISGGWVRNFTVSEAGNGTLDFDWRQIQSPDFESNEFTQVLVKVDGTTFTVDTIFGNGNGGPDRDSGPQSATINLGTLSAGTHTITIGGFVNQKTFSNEFVDVYFDDVVVQVESQGCPLTVPLDTKGVNFGEITVECDGTVDYSAVEGVDAPALRVRPFFAQGRTRTIREFIFGALNDEMGIQVHDPVLCAVTDPVSPQAMTSPAGFQYDPSTDTFERPPGCGGPSEVDVAIVDHLEFYLLNYFKPGRYVETARTQQGDALLDTIGCTECHVRNLTVDSDRRVADVETVFDPVNGIFNELFATGSTRFVVQNDPSSPFPFVLPAGNSFVVENIFTDFKRHDLGPDFDERDYDGTVLTEHITEALWGVGSTAPYGHDGRSINLDAVIRRHGGEAASSTLAFANLSADDQNKILEFLNTLILFPPDDTASNLNPGNPGSSDPQNPANHGSINLGALFQINSNDIGPE